MKHLEPKISNIVYHMSRIEEHKSVILTTILSRKNVMYQWRSPPENSAQFGRNIVEQQ